MGTADDIPLPIQEGLRDFLGLLVGRGVAVDKSRSAPSRDARHLVARYTDDDGAVLAACWADLRLAAVCGAALAMVPAAALEDVERTGDLPPHLADNWYEVANVLSGLLNSSAGPHLVLTDVETAVEIDDPTWQVVEQPSRQRCFDVTVEGYGSGVLGLAVA